MIYIIVRGGTKILAYLRELFGRNKLSDCCLKYTAVKTCGMQGLELI